MPSDARSDGVLPVAVAAGDAPLRDVPYCPSAQPEWKGSTVFGLVEGSPRQPRVTYLRRRLPVVPELLGLTEPVRPTEVLRVAAPCANGACHHFASGVCRLAEKVVRLLPAVADALPECTIRSSCRWFGQEGGAACLRCPQVVTDHLSLDPVMHEVTDPRR